MRKKFLALLAIIAITTGSFAQGKVIVKGSKNVTSVTTKIEKFKRLILNQNFKITLEKGNAPKVTVETDDNIHKFVEAKVAKDGTLDLFISAIIRSKEALNVTVTYVEGLETIEIKDQAEINSNSELEFKTLSLSAADDSKTNLSLKAEKLNFTNQGNCDVFLNVKADEANLDLNSQRELQGLINAKKLNINVKNSASGDISGEAEEANINVENASSFSGSNLNVKNVNLTTGTGSNIQVKATNKLSIETNGSSTVTVSENPSISVKGLIGTLVLKKL